MEYPYLTKANAKDRFDELFPEDGQLICPQIKHNANVLFNRLRENMLKVFDKAEKDGITSFKLDILMSMELYEGLRPIIDVPLNILSSFEFWYSIGLELIPDLIFRRYSSADRVALQKRYYAKSLRIWPFMLWWGAHLTWQGDREKTLLLLNNGFTVTAYETLLDRSGYGYPTELFREIALQFSRIYQGYHVNDRELLRAVITLNTSKIVNIEPCFYTGGISGYVEDLFKPFLGKLKKKTARI